MISVGPYALEARLRGDGRPTVVFEADLAGGFSPYQKLQNEIAAKTRTLAYERAGYGRSGSGPEAPTAEQTARDLRALLGAAGIGAPVILVCHGVGCLYARVFAHAFPSQTAGLVFVDPMTKSFYDRMKASPAAWRKAGEALPAAARRERAALPTTLSQAHGAWPLPQVPCVVITAMKPLGQWPFATRDDMSAWLAADEAFVARLPQVVHVVLPQATHSSMLDSSEVEQTILRMVEQVRAEGPGTGSGAHR